ncbi:tetratricopeptide repeat protein [Pseudoalteromonas sp. NJ631]|uniref:tetratricopeptide repeat protein n=1 Tax=Pseudoalteromonas sp. NJ631 TaxID=493915 RepID=UPI0002D83254|nr:hypothetical protein [Pseudoalteromonas sp. NJ631]
MKDLAQLELLIEKQKYKKALPLAKKLVNHDSGFRVTELLGMAQHGVGQYGLAAINLKKAAELAATSSQKAVLYRNAGICYQNLGDKYQLQALQAFELSLQFAPGFDNIQMRVVAAELAFSLNQYDLALSLAAKLMAYSDYAALGLVITLRAHLAKGDQTSFEKQMLIIEGESNAFPEQEAKNLLVTLKEADKQSWFMNMLGLFSNRFSHQDWFQYLQGLQIQQQLTAEKPEELIVSDSNEVAEIIRQLVEEIKRYGGSVSEDLRLVACQGNLSIKAFNQQPKVLIDIPLECMPLLDDFEFEVNGNTLISIPKKELLNPTAVKTMSLMVELYNKADKVTQWKLSSPFFTLSKDRALLEKLCDGKKLNTKVNKDKRLALEEKWGELFLSSFFGSRKFAYKNDFFNIGKEGYTSGLLSIIDFFNHRCGASPYKLSNKGISVEGTPGNAEAEVFVNYNQFDPLLTYLIYGFVDCASDYLFSIPCHISLAELEFEVFGNTAVLDVENRSNRTSHLAAFLPNIAVKEQSVGIDKLLITPKHPELLREAIQTVLLSVMDKDKINDVILADLVKSFEKQLLTQNISYWREVEALAAESALENSVIDSVNLLCKESKSMIQRYASKHSITLF